MDVSIQPRQLFEFFDHDKVTDKQVTLARIVTAISLRRVSLAEISIRQQLCSDTRIIQHYISHLKQWHDLE